NVMVKTFNIQNFRCFRNVSLDGLKRFNIIVGDNGSGKTSLLEAMFLVASASPGVWLKLRFWRGAGQTIRLTGTKTSYESLFRDLFHDFKGQKGATIGITDSDLGRRSVNITYSGRETYRLPPGEEVANAFLIDLITFYWSLKDSKFKT